MIKITKDLKCVVWIWVLLKAYSFEWFSFTFFNDIYIRLFGYEKGWKIILFKANNIYTSNCYTYSNRSKHYFCFENLASWRAIIIFCCWCLILLYNCASFCLLLKWYFQPYFPRTSHILVWTKEVMFKLNSNPTKN